MNKLRISILILGFILSASSSYGQCLAGGEASGWYNENWTYRKKITIDCSMVDTEEQSNIPILIHLSTDAELAADAQNDFDDVLFTDTDGSTKLDHEIERYDPGTGELWAWVEIPTLLFGTDTVIYMYYGNPSASDQRDVEGTWDEGGVDNYILVQHMTGSTYTELDDSTSNNNDVDSVQGSPLYDQTGQIAGAVYVDGRANQELLSIPDSASLDLTNNLTIEYWVKTDGTGMPYPSTPRWKAVVWKNTSYFSTYQSSDNTLFSYYYTSTGNVQTDNGNCPNDTWTRYVATYSNVTGTTAYVDDTTLGTSAANGSITTSTSSFEIGGHAGQDRYFQGYIDEIRVSKTVRSESWVITQYNNQSTDYLTLGAAEVLSNIDVSGTTDLADGVTVAVAVEGVVQAGKTGTTSGGTWTISGIDTPESGDVITVWVVDGETNGNKSTAVTRYDGAGYISGVVLNEHILTIGSNDDMNVTLADLGVYDNDDDSDILHSSNAGVLDVDVGNLYVDSALDLIVDMAEANLTIGSDDTFNTNGYDLDLSGNLTIAGALDTTDDIEGDGTTINLAGNFDATGGTFTSTDSTVIFDGTSTVTSDSEEFNNVEIGSATAGASVTTADDMAINGSLIVNDGDATTWDISDDTVSAAGAFNLTNLDTFTVSSSTVTFNGTAAQTITTDSESYNNLSVSNSADDVTFVDGFTVGGNFTCSTAGASLKFQQGETFTVTGNFTLSGVSGSDITVDSVSGAATFDLNVSGIGAAHYVEVSYSDASGGNEIDASDGTNTDSGNNTNWDFTGSGGSCAAGGSALGWYNSNFQRRKKITIDCAMTRSADQNNFPTLIYTSADANLAADAQADGDDIVFTAENGTTKLDHEIEKFDSGTGELWAWVEIPTLENLTDTVIYIYYRNATASNQENVEGTWDEGGSDNFTAVWHMAEDPSISTDGDCGGGTDEECDSTSNSNDADMQGTMTNGDLVDGKVGYAIDFDGSDDYFDVTDDASLDFGSGDFTMEAWVYKNDDDAYRMVVNSRPASTNQWFFGIDDSNNVNWYQEISGTSNDLTSSSTVLAANGWIHIVGVTERGGDTQIYINGTLDNSVADGLTGDLNPVGDVRIGQDNLGSGDWSPSFFNGQMDEFRIVKGVARSGGWIKTEYYNQNTPAVFLTYGAPENAPVIEGADDAVFFGTNF